MLLAPRPGSSDDTDEVRIYSGSRVSETASKKAKDFWNRKPGKINSQTSTWWLPSSRLRIVGLATSHILLLLVCCFPGSALSDFSDQKFTSRKTHWAVTEHKFEIALTRLRLGNDARRRTPVILIHGLMVDSRFLDLGRDTSLAEYLAQAGFDVWNVSLRGTGRSLNPLGWGEKPWSLDDMVEQDLPTVIDYVKKETGSETVFLVGYELGGVLALAYLGTNPTPGVAGLVSIAAPLTFDSPAQQPLKALLRLDSNPQLKKLLLYVSVPVLGQFALPFFSNAEKVFYNPENIDPLVKQNLLTNSLIPVNPGVLDQVIMMVQKGEAVSANGKRSYRDSLSKVDVPLLIIGGAGDAIAPPKALEKVYREVGSDDRELMIFWSDPDEDVSYGHFDLILGRNAGKEIFPLVRDWLELKATDPDKSNPTQPLKPETNKPGKMLVEPSPR